MLLPDWRRIPAPPKRLITNPRAVLLPPLMVNPFTPDPALLPFNSMIGVPANPGCVVPSMVTGPVMVGKADSGAMVCTPEPMAKVIVSGPGFALALSRVQRSEPMPLSLVLVTVYRG